MAIALLLEFHNSKQEQYDKVMKGLGLETNNAENIPDGLVCHFAYAKEGNWAVVDVWESRRQFDTFLQERLMPALRDASLPEPEVKEYELYNLMLGKRTPVLSGMR